MIFFLTKNKAKLFFTGIILTALVLNFTYAKGEAFSNDGVFDEIYYAYASSMKSWATVFTSYAKKIFLYLATVSFAWILMQLLLKGGEINDFLSEIVKYMIGFGFFYWFLENGVHLGAVILNSFQEMGKEASGYSVDISPSVLPDMGFQILASIIDSSSVWSPIKSVFAIFIGIIIVCVMSWVGIRFMILKITGWIVLYAGIVSLGFSGGVWTRDVAINYIKGVIGFGLQIMTFILIVTIGLDMIMLTFDAVEDETITYMISSLILVQVGAIAVFCEAIPPIVSGLVSNSNFSADNGKVFQAGMFGGGLALGTTVGVAGGMAGNLGAGVAELAMELSQDPSAGAGTSSIDLASMPHQTPWGTPNALSPSEGSSGQNSVGKG